jgi:endonuclease-3
MTNKIKSITPSKEILAKKNNTAKKLSAASTFLPSNKKILSHKLVTKVTANKMMDILQKEYPDAECELTFKTPFQLLIAVILSAQTTDVSVNKVTPALFKEFPDAKALASANIERIKTLIKQTGFYNAKAHNIQACAQQLMEEFGEEVPKTQEELTKLRGVGRKTANVVLGVIHGIPGWTVDTHVQRLSKRLGFTHETDPLKIEKALEKIFPEKNWSKLSITLIFHGRRICFARKPACHLCHLNTLCPSAYKVT